MDQGGQAGGEDDPPLLSPLPLKPVRLALSLLAYNLGNLWRRLTLPKRIENWSLTSLQQRLVKTGGRLVKRAPLLLATAGGRTSDAAAVRGDAGPDRDATDTAGIGGSLSSRQRNPSISWLG